MNVHSMMIMQAIIEVMVTYSDQEIGYNAGVDLERLERYLGSPATMLAYKEATTVEECMEIFTEEILNGEPVWRLLKIPKWTSDMLEREFAVLVAEHEAAMKRKYKCLTCKYYEGTQTALGVIDKCIYEEVHRVKTDSLVKHRLHSFDMRCRREPFELKTKCKKYEVLDNVE